MRLPTSHVGFYDRPGISTPTRDAAWPVPCPICERLVTRGDCRTTGIRLENSQMGTIFYRSHKSCNEAMTDEERRELDTLAIRAGLS